MKKKINWNKEIIKEKVSKILTIIWRALLIIILGFILFGYLYQCSNNVKSLDHVTTNNELVNRDDRDYLSDDIVDDIRGTWDFNEILNFDNLNITGGSSISLSFIGWFGTESENNVTTLTISRTSTYQVILSGYNGGSYVPNPSVIYDTGNWYTYIRRIHFSSLDVSTTDDVASKFLLFLQVNALKDTYQDGYNNGYQVGYDEGLNQGYNNGYQIGFDEGLNQGYNDGYNNGVVVGENNAGIAENGFITMFNIILTAPFNIFNGLLNFELFGVNLFNVFSFVITAFIILWVVKKFL